MLAHIWPVSMVRIESSVRWEWLLLWWISCRRCRQEYLDNVASAIQSFQKYLPTTVAYTSIDDVNVNSTKNNMQSFWFGEVLKYLYVFLLASHVLKLTCVLRPICTWRLTIPTRFRSMIACIYVSSSLGAYAVCLCLELVTPRDPDPDNGNISWIRSLWTQSDFDPIPLSVAKSVVPFRLNMMRDASTLWGAIWKGTQASSELPESNSKDAENVVSRTRPRDRWIATEDNYEAPTTSVGRARHRWPLRGRDTPNRVTSIEKERLVELEKRARGSEDSTDGFVFSLLIQSSRRIGTRTVMFNNRLRETTRGDRWCLWTRDSWL